MTMKEVHVAEARGVPEMTLAEILQLFRQDRLQREVELESE